jgi:hypothetical protein
VPAGVDAPETRVRVEELPAVTDDGLKLAEAPVGRPLAERLTAWAEPLVTAVESVVVPLAPCATETLDGLAAIEKSFVAAVVTVSVTLVVWVALAPVPVTVTV